MKNFADTRSTDIDTDIGTDIGTDSDTDTAADSDYRVSVWEGIAIVGGAVLIVAAGLVGLGVKALSNVFDPQRAEAIAQSMMAYELPGGSSGVFGTNIGGGKMAVISSKATVSSMSATNPANATPIQQSPAVELFIARTPLEEPKVEDRLPPEPQNELFSGFSFSYQDPSAFQAEQEQTEQKLFCGIPTPVKIQSGKLNVEEAAPLAAVKYEVKRVLDAESHIVVVSALGDNAAQEAAKTFNSLVCR